MPGSFFTTDGATGGAERFTPTEHARGPWHAEHCHAGPPTGLLARAVERLVPDRRLTRLSVTLSRPIPHAGFRIEAGVTRAGRTVSLVAARIVGDDGRAAATAEALLMTRQPARDVPTHTESLGSPDDAAPGGFPILETLHGLPAFNGAGVEARYPPGETREPGPTAAWLRTVPLLPDEAPSPFQRICPLADCGNAFGRNADPRHTSFANADLTIVLHRDPVGDWLGTRSTGYWEPDGIGLADAQLFDERGAVGRALQTLLLLPGAG